jgi:hypothetical protein
LYRKFKKRLFGSSRDACVPDFGSFRSEKRIQDTVPFSASWFSLAPGNF